MIPGAALLSSLRIPAWREQSRASWSATVMCIGPYASCRDSTDAGFIPGSGTTQHSDDHAVLVCCIAIGLIKVDFVDVHTCMVVLHSAWCEQDPPVHHMCTPRLDGEWS